MLNSPPPLGASLALGPAYALLGPTFLKGPDGPDPSTVLILSLPWRLPQRRLCCQPVPRGPAWSNPLPPAVPPPLAPHPLAVLDVIRHKIQAVLKLEVQDRAICISVRRQSAVGYVVGARAAILRPTRRAHTCERVEVARVLRNFLACSDLLFRYGPTQADRIHLLVSFAASARGVAPVIRLAILADARRVLWVPGRVVAHPVRWRRRGCFHRVARPDRVANLLAVPVGRALVNADALAGSQGLLVGPILTLLRFLPSIDLAVFALLIGAEHCFQARREFARLAFGLRGIVVV
eukprot:scaffold34_cov62-Phaeocystis_antarctica.AAC.3